jgi:ferredoxin-NADP reductase/Na+-translocating ferredoxin:NAD+ oxidoreductase RnfD subunit
MKTIDRLLDHTTMYRLVLWHLIALIVAAVALSFFGLVPYTPASIVFSTALIVAVCWVANLVFARVFQVPPNQESIYITALIVALIMSPVGFTDVHGVGGLVFAAVWAMAGKYVFAVGRKHVFNPAAFGVALPALLINQPATWWVGGNLPLLPVVFIGGVLIVRKLHRLDLILTFMAVVFVTILATTAPSNDIMTISETLKHSPIFFFAFVMLTEPLTQPATRLPRLIFAALVGFLYSPNVHIGSFYFTPELALMVGNVFAWAISPKGRFVLTLERIERAAADTYDFVFSTPHRLAFQAGQYLEWTLGIDHADNRGNRRYFTVASAPTESEIRLGVKFYKKPSAFKRALGDLVPGDTIHATQVAGNFTLPSNPDKKLAFLAGGIGITPFRSMLQYLIDEGNARPITVLYGCEANEDIAYGEVLDEAERRLGIRTIYAIAKGARRGQYPGYIDARLVKAAIPDYLERTFYVSGPQPMVKAVRHTLTSMGVHRTHIKTDFFPGFA